MAPRSDSSPGLRAQYRAELDRERTPRVTRVAAAMVALINTSTIPLDRYVFPDHFALFLPIRVVLDLLLAWACFGLARSRPRRAQALVALSTGAMLLTVVHGSGGVDSPYYAGIMLLFMGLPVISTMNGREGAGVVAAVLLGLLAGPLWTGMPDWSALAIPGFFLSFGGVLAVTAAELLDRARFTDFRQRCELETARDHLAELDQAKGRFTANVHHELRTPLTLMLAPIDTLLGGDLGEISDGQRSYLRTVRENGLRLLKLINHLLDLAKIESRQKQLDRRRVDAGALAQSLVERARPLAERKGVALRGIGLEGLPPLCADIDAFEKILINLIGNALKFTDRGGEIRVEAEAQPQGIRFRVVDTGIGIPPHQLERIFDRFAQVDATATRRHEGTGIGLALVRELVALHGGEVSASSQGPGHGSTLSFSLPFGVADGVDVDADALHSSDGRTLGAAQAFEAVRAELGLGSEADQAEYQTVELSRSANRAVAREGAEIVAIETAGASAPEVLIAEDNPDMRRLFALLLSRDYRLRLAPDGEQALRAVRERLPDLVLSDVMMPGLSGLELCRAIKGDPALRGVPMVLVTSKAEREMKIEGLELGADDYVTKPFHPRELLARVRALLRVTQLQRELAERNARLERALSELRNAEVQLVQAERLAAVGELAAGVAHEVNNPVNFALNAARVLQTELCALAPLLTTLAADESVSSGPLRREIEKLGQRERFQELVPELLELTGIIQNGLDRTQRLVVDLRDFAAPGRGAQAELVDLRRCVESTLLLLGRSLGEAGIQVQHAPPAELAPVRGQAAALNQLLLNLLKNAQEALADRPGKIEITWIAAAGRIGLQVADDGPGIAPEVQARLFEPFFTTKPAGSGSGLGLSVSRRIAEEHAGQLEVESELGRGTRFTLWLPAATDEGQVEFP